MAEESGQINVEANVTDQGFKSGLDAINSALNSAMQRFNAVSKASRDLRLSVDGTETALRGLSNNLKGISGSVATLKNNQLALAVAYRQTKNAVVELNGALAKEKAQNGQVSASTQRVLQYNKALEQSYKAIARSAKAADLKSVATAYNTSAQRMNYTAMRLTAGLTLPLTMFMRKGFDSLKRLNEEQIRTSKLLDDSGVSAEQLSRNLTNLDKRLDSLTFKWGISRELVQGLAGDFAELGISSPKALAQLTQITTEVEKLGNVDITQSQAFVQSIYQNITRIKREAGQNVTSEAALQNIISEVRGAVALFNYAENKTSLSLRNIADAFPEVSAAATSFGLTMASTAGMLVPMVAAGFQVGASANSIKVSLQRLVIPTKQNQQYIDALSKELGGKLQISSTVGAEGIQKLIDAFITLRKSSYGTQGTLELFGRIFGVRQGPRMEVAIEQLAQFQEQLNNTNSTERKILGTLEESINAKLRANKLDTISLKSFQDLQTLQEVGTRKEAKNTVLRTGANQEIRRTTDEYTLQAKLIQEAQQEQAQKIAKNVQLQKEFNNISTESGKILVGAAFGTGVTGATLESELKKAEKRLDVQYGKARESIKFIQRELVTVFGDLLSGINPVLQKIAEWFKSLPTAIKKFAGIGLLILAALGPVVRVISLLRTGMGGITTVQSKMAGGFGIIRKQAVEVNTALLKQSDIMARLGKKGVLSETGGKVFLTARRGTLKRVQKLGQLETERELTGSVTAGFKERRLIKKLGLGAADFSGLKEETKRSLFGISKKKTMKPEDVLENATKVIRSGSGTSSGGVVTPFGTVRPQIQVADQVKQASTNSLRTVLEQIKSILEAIKQCVCNAKQAAGVKPAPATTGAPANAPPAPPAPSTSTPRPTPRPASGATSGSTTIPVAPTPTSPKINLPFSLPIPIGTTSGVKKIINQQVKNTKNLINSLTEFDTTVEAQVSQVAETTKKAATVVKRKIQEVTLSSGTKIPFVQTKVFKPKELEGLESSAFGLAQPISKEGLDKALEKIKRGSAKPKAESRQMPAAMKAKLEAEKEARRKEQAMVEAETKAAKEAESVAKKTTKAAKEGLDKAGRVKQTVTITKEWLIKTLETLGYEIPQAIKGIPDNFARDVQTRTAEALKTALNNPANLGAFIGGKKNALFGGKRSTELERSIFNALDTDASRKSREASSKDVRNERMPKASSAKLENISTPIDPEKGAADAYRRRSLRFLKYLQEKEITLKAALEDVNNQILQASNTLGQLDGKIKVPQAVAKKGTQSVVEYLRSISDLKKQLVAERDKIATSLNVIKGGGGVVGKISLVRARFAGVPANELPGDFFAPRSPNRRLPITPKISTPGRPVITPEPLIPITEQLSKQREALKQTISLRSEISKISGKADPTEQEKEQIKATAKAIGSKTRTLKTQAEAIVQHYKNIENQIITEIQALEEQRAGLAQQYMQGLPARAGQAPVGQTASAAASLQRIREARAARQARLVAGGQTEAKGLPEEVSLFANVGGRAEAAMSPEVAKRIGQQIAALQQRIKETIDQATIKTLNDQINKLENKLISAGRTATGKALPGISGGAFDLSALDKIISSIKLPAGVSPEQLKQEIMSRSAKLAESLKMDSEQVKDALNRIIEGIKQNLLTADQTLEGTYQAIVAQRNNIYKLGKTPTAAIPKVSGTDESRKDFAKEFAEKARKVGTNKDELMQLTLKNLQYVAEIIAQATRKQAGTKEAAIKIILDALGVATESAVINTVEKPVRKAKKAVEQATVTAKAQVEDNVAEVANDSLAAALATEKLVRSLDNPIKTVRDRVQNTAQRAAAKVQDNAAVVIADANSVVAATEQLVVAVDNPIKAVRDRVAATANRAAALGPKFSTGSVFGSMLPAAAPRVAPPSIKDIPIPIRPSRVEKYVPFRGRVRPSVLGEKFRESTGMPVTARGAARFGAGLVTAGFSEAALFGIKKVSSRLLAPQQVKYAKNPYDFYVDAKNQTSRDRGLGPESSARQGRKAELEARRIAKEVAEQLAGITRLSNIVSSIPSKFALRFKSVRDNIEAIGNIYGPGLIESINKAKIKTKVIARNAASAAKNISTGIALAPLQVNKIIFEGTISGLEKVKTTTNNIDPIIKKGINRAFDGLKNAIKQSAETNAKKLENEPAGRQAFSNALYKTVIAIVSTMQMAANMYVSYTRILVNTTAQAGIIVSKAMITVIGLIGNPARTAAMAINGIKSAGIAITQAFKNLPGTLKQGVDLAIRGTKSLFNMLGSAVKSLGPRLLSLAGKMPIVGRPLFGGVITQNQQGQNVRSGGLFRSTAVQQTNGEWQKTGPGFGGRAVGGLMNVASAGLNAAKGALGGFKKMVGGTVGAVGNLASMMAYSLGPAGYLLMPMINSLVAGVAKLQMRFIVISVVIGLVVAVIKSLKNTFSQWSGSSGGAAERMKKTWEEIKKLFLSLMNIFIGFFLALTGGGKKGEKGAKGVGEAVSSIATAFEKALPVIKKVFEVIKQGLTTFLSGVKVIIEGVIKLVSGIVDFVKAIIAKIKGDNDKASDLFSSAWEKVKEGIGKILGGLVKIFASVFKIIINVVAKVAEFIINIFERIGDGIILGIQYAIIGVIKALFFIPRTIVQVVDQVIDVFTSLQKAVIDIYKFIVTKFVEYFFKIPSGAVTVVQKVISIFAGLVGANAKIINKLADMFFSFFQSIIDAPKKLGWLGNLISKALDVTVGSALDGVQGLIDGITSKINEGAEEFKNYVGDIAGDIQNTITSAKEKTIGAINAIAGAGKGALSFMAGLGDGILSLLDKMQNGAEGGVTNLANWVRAKLGGLSDLPGTLGQLLIGWIDKVADGIDNIAPATLKAVKDTEEEIKNLDPSAAERAGQTIADAINKGLKSLKQNFFDKVLGNLDKSLEGLADKLKKALDKQKEQALKVFDDQIAAIDALAAAEEELTAKEKAEADKRDRERERQLQRQNNFRQRALAIYEGRIDDARTLLEEEQKAQVEYDKAVKETQQEEDRAARAKNREIAKGVIANQKNAASEQFDKTVEDFSKFVDQLIAKGTLTEEELANNFNAIASQAGIASAAMQSSLESYFTAVPSLITQYAGPNAEFFGTSLNTLIDVAKTKYGIDTQNASPDSILGATKAMLSGTATEISTAFTTQILPSYNAGQNGISDINKKISDPTSDLNPKKVYGKAISDANDEIKLQFMKMKTEAGSAFEQVVNAINDEVKNLAIAQAITEAKEELKKAPKTIAGAIASANLTGETADQALGKVLFGDIWSQPLKNADGTPMLNADGTQRTLGDMYNGRYYGGMIKKMYGGGVPKYAIGGSVPGVTMQGVPALLHGGEYVINSKAVQNIGTSFLQYLNGLRNGVPQIKLPNAQIPNNLNSATSVNNNTQVETTHNYNIFVDNFIGENQWFESMMKEYNLKVVPNSQKAAGLESRVIRSYNRINKGL